MCLCPFRLSFGPSGLVEWWLKLADAEQSSDRKPEVARALEEALKRKPDLWPRRTQAMEHYLEPGDTGAAKRHLAAAIPLLPAIAIKLQTEIFVDQYLDGVAVIVRDHRQWA